MLFKRYERRKEKSSRNSFCEYCIARPQTTLETPVQSKAQVLTHGETIEEGIAGVALGAAAYRIVIAHDAAGVRGARADTGVLTALIDTSARLLAVGARDALGPAARWLAKVTDLAGARCLLAKLAAHAVRAAGRGWARPAIGRRWFCERRGEKKTKKRVRLRSALTAPSSEKPLSVFSGREATMAKDSWNGLTVIIRTGTKKRVFSQESPGKWVLRWYLSSLKVAQVAASVTTSKRYSGSLYTLVCTYRNYTS